MHTEEMKHRSLFTVQQTHNALKLKEYEEKGYYIEDNIINCDRCEQLIARSAQLENAKNSSYRPQMMPHRSDALFLDALKTPKIVEMVRLFCYGDPVGLQTEFFFCKPGTRGFSLHQDNFFVEANYGVFLSAWIALTDTTPEKGGLIVYPGSHKERLLPVQKTNLRPEQAQDPNANNENCIVPSQYQPINVSVPKGSALFIHGNLVHGSNMNMTNEFRYVLLCTYIKTGEKFRVGKYAQRNIVQLT